MLHGSSSGNGTNKGDGDKMLAPKRISTSTLVLPNTGPTAKDYIQDGLVAMWDGIENAGWGVHDENATTWKDLTGNEHTATLTDKGHFETNYLDKVVDGAGAVAEMFSWSFVEIVFSATTGTRNSLILFANSGTTGKIIWAAGYLGQTYGKAFPIASLSSTMYYATEIGSVNNSYYNGLEVENTGSVQAWGGRSKIYIGGRDDNANSDPGKYYSLRFYNRVLSPEEIAYNYSIDNKRFNLDGNFPKRNKRIGLFLTPPPKIPYVKDGLIAMWDGTWNKDLDVHDENATVWKDLTENGNDLEVDLTQSQWSSDRLRITGETCTRSSEITGVETAEVLYIDQYSNSYPNNDGSFFTFGEGKGPGAWWYAHLVGGSKQSPKIAISTNSFSSNRKILRLYTYKYSDYEIYINGTPYTIYIAPVSHPQEGVKAVCKSPSQYIEIVHVRLYNRALSPEEIAYNYSIDNKRFNLDGSSSEPFSLKTSRKILGLYLVPPSP